MGKHAVLLLCVLSATTMARPVASSRSAWVGASATAVVTTNAPVLRWSSQVESTGTFAYSVDVTDATGAAVWSSGEV